MLLSTVEQAVAFSNAQTAISCIHFRDLYHSSSFFILVFRYGIKQKHARRTLHCILRMRLWLFKTIVWALLMSVTKRIF